MSTKKSPETLFRRTNWPLLRRQKRTLLKVIEEQKRDSVRDQLLGLVCMLDEMQDTAVDVLGIPEEEVFGISEKA
jgi:hypothetical protein